MLLYEDGIDIDARNSSVKTGDADLHRNVGDGNIKGTSLDFLMMIVLLILLWRH